MDREISSRRKIKQNIEMGLLYACTKGKNRACYTECPKYEKCRGDEGGSGIYGDDSGLRRFLFGGF